MSPEKSSMFGQGFKVEEKKIESMQQSPNKEIPLQSPPIIETPVTTDAMYKTLQPEKIPALVVEH